MLRTTHQVSPDQETKCSERTTSSPRWMLCFYIRLGEQSTCYGSGLCRCWGTADSRLAGPWPLSLQRSLHNKTERQPTDKPTSECRYEKYYPCRSPRPSEAFAVRKSDLEGEMPKDKQAAIWLRLSERRPRQRDQGLNSQIGRNQASQGDKEKGSGAQQGRAWQAVSCWLQNTEQAEKSDFLMAIVVNTGEENKKRSSTSIL